jgi:hypothetical protein
MDHSLTHLSEEVELFGKFDNCYAFEFENYMQTLKKYSQSAKKSGASNQLPTSRVQFV